MNDQQYPNNNPDCAQENQTNTNENTHTNTKSVSAPRFTPNFNPPPYPNFNPNSNPNSPYSDWQTPVNNGKNFSVAAIVFGIIGIVLGSTPVLNMIVLICSILGIVFGVKGRKMSLAATGTSSGLATAGLVLGIIGLCFAVVGFLCTTAVCSLIIIGMNEVESVALSLDGQLLAILFT